MREISNKINISTKSCINDKSKYLAPVTINSVEIVPFTMKKIITHNPPFFPIHFILSFPTFKFLKDLVIVLECDTLIEIYYMNIRNRIFHENHVQLHTTIPS